MDRRSFITRVVPAAGVALAAGAPAARAAAPATADLVISEIARNVTLIAGAGGNVTVLRTPEGVLMVDGGASQHSSALLAAVKAIAGSDRVHTLFNTHWHADQTGSNARLGAAGTRI